MMEFCVIQQIVSIFYFTFYSQTFSSLYLLVELKSFFFFFSEKERYMYLKNLSAEILPINTKH